ncbi:hypothetical protein MIND_00507700 [Mycena indigotica]|uniref:Uncharacterized protein n=1 Tax=Mycena indigotica TaxID=2126181 RepID=A0A8H6W9Z2_9AGAR|nr:uncharacterized protein MIND_00507700 [Mycena indigotica]KAF7307143.1 hypothetical protein MIND_00507700 [Mycena indigotica]
MTLSRSARTRTLATASLLPLILAQFHSFYTEHAPDPNVYTPHPHFLVLLFAIQLAQQCYWLYQMFYPPDGRANRRRFGEEESQPLDGHPRNTTQDIDDNTEPTQMAYAPVYALCNVFFVIASLTWTLYFLISHLFVFLAAAAQLYAVFGLLGPDGKYSPTRRNHLTHLVAKTNAGFSIVYLARSWGALGIGASRPVFQQQAFLAVALLIMTLTAGPDPTIGLSLVLDLAALAAGSAIEEWRIAFAAIIGVLFVVVLSDSALAWKNGRLHPAPELITDIDAYHDSEQIYLSDIRTPTEDSFPTEQV